MEAVLGLKLVVGLLALKVMLIRANWQMAGEQGKPPFASLIVGVLFSALIVFLALHINRRPQPTSPDEASS